MASQCDLAGTPPLPLPEEPQLYSSNNRPPHVEQNSPNGEPIGAPQLGQAFSNSAPSFGQ